MLDGKCFVKYLNYSDTGDGILNREEFVKFPLSGKFASTVMIQKRRIQ